MANPTAQQLFEPVREDYALGVLKKLFGCTIDKLWTAGQQGSCTDSTLITDALSYFNLGCLILAGVVGTYLLYSLVADTANDGEVLGRSSDTKYTLLRAGIGGGLALPIANGLSVVQILALQLLVWGSGLGDNVWAKVSQSMIGSTAAQLTIDRIDPQMNSGLMGSAAQALKTRIGSYVCSFRLTQVGNTLSGDTGRGLVNALGGVDEPEYSGGSKVADVWVYRFGGDSFWNNNNNLCGEVHYRIPSPTLPSGASTVSDQVASAVSTLVVSATQAAMNAGMTELDNQARQIAQGILNNQRDATTTANAIKAALKSVTDTVTNTLYQNLQQGLSSPSQSIVSAINSSTQEGWMKAMLYQRLLTNSYSAISSAFGGVTFGSTDPGTLSSYLSWSAYLGSSSSIYAPIVTQYNSDISYLQTFNNLFAALGSGSGSGSTGDGTGATVMDSSVGTRISQAMLWVITPSTDYGTGWRDPIPDIARAGNSLTYLAGLMAAASGIASLFGPIVNYFGSLSGYVATFIALLAFILAGLIPLLPLVYFIGGAVSWLIVALEAMIAVPLWLLTYFFPARDANLIGQSKQGFLLLTGVLVRPALIIIGLVGGMFIMRVGYDFLCLMFRNAFAATSGAGFGASLMLIVGIVFVFVLAVLTLVVNCCSLITELGDAVLRWIDVNAQSLFAARFGNDVSGIINAPARGAKALETPGAAMGNAALRGARGSGKGVGNYGKKALTGPLRP